MFDITRFSLVAVFLKLTTSYADELNNIQYVQASKTKEKGFNGSTKTTLKDSCLPRTAKHQKLVISEANTEITVTSDDVSSSINSSGLSNAKISDLTSYITLISGNGVSDSIPYKTKLRKETSYSDYSASKKLSTNVDKTFNLRTYPNMPRFSSHDGHHEDVNTKSATRPVKKITDVVFNNIDGGIDKEEINEQNNPNISVIESVYKDLPLFDSLDVLNNSDHVKSPFNEELGFDNELYDNKAVDNITYSRNKTLENDFGVHNLMQPLKDIFSVEIMTQSNDSNIIEHTKPNKKRSYSTMNQTHINHDHIYAKNIGTQDTVCTINNTSTASYGAVIVQQPSLRKINEECWEFDFTLNGITFNNIVNSSLFNNLIFKYNGNNNYKQINDDKNECQSMNRQRNITRLYFRFIVPVYITIEFTTVGQIKYFSITSVSKSNGIIQLIRGSVVFHKTEGPLRNLNIFLNNNTNFSWNILILTLYEARFPIFDFSKYQYHKVIVVESYNSGSTSDRISISEYFKKFNEMTFYFTNSQYHLYQDFFKGKKEISINEESKISWFHSIILIVKITRKIITIFDEIQNIISDITKQRINSKRQEIYAAIENILSNLNPNCNIVYTLAKNRYSYHEEEILVSFYIFLNQELKPVLEYWKKYIFNVHYQEFIEGNVYF